MDEEYDVGIQLIAHERVLIVLPLGHCPRHWPHRVYPVGVALRRGQEGLAYGPQRLLWGRQCQLELDSGLQRRLFSCWWLTVITALPQIPP